MKIIKLFILGFILGAFLGLLVNQIMIFDKDVTDVLNPDFIKPVMINGDV